MSYQKINPKTANMYTSQSTSQTEKLYWTEKQLKERASIERQVALKAAVEIIVAYKDKFSFEEAKEKLQTLAHDIYSNVLYLQD